MTLEERLQRCTQGQMCLYDLPSRTILAPRDLVPGWSAVWEELLKESFNQKPTESSGAVIFLP